MKVIYVSRKHNPIKRMHNLLKRMITSKKGIAIALIYALAILGALWLLVVLVALILGVIGAVLN